LERSAEKSKHVIDDKRNPLKVQKGIYHRCGIDQNDGSRACSLRLILASKMTSTCQNRLNHLETERLVAKI
jgi:hypothetical protein